MDPNEHPLRMIIRRFVESKLAEGYKHASYFGIDWDAPYCCIKKDDYFISLWTVDRDGNAARHIDNAVWNKPYFCIRFFGVIFLARSAQSRPGLFYWHKKGRRCTASARGMKGEQQNKQS